MLRGCYVEFSCSTFSLKFSLKLNIPHLPCNYALFSVHVCVWLICADSLSPISLFSMLAIVDLAKEPLLLNICISPSVHLLSVFP